MNYFEEGGDAYRAWIAAHCVPEMPACPYPKGSVEAEQWEVGFDDAMYWELEGQYLD
jgi:hypothetical protein